jgi:hypothetical protein
MIDDDDDDETAAVITAAPVATAVTLQFADGVYTLNRAMVAHLGGTAQVLEYADAARLITRQQFVDGFWQLVAADVVNRVQQQIVSAHLARAQPLLTLDEDVTFIKPFGGGTI